MLQAAADARPTRNGPAVCRWPRLRRRRTCAGPRRCASRRAAGRGGGGFGSETGSSLSIANYRVPSQSRIEQSHSDNHSPGRASWAAAGAGGEAPAAVSLYRSSCAIDSGAPGCADELEELGPVAEFVRAARRIGDPQHIVIAERAGVASAAQQLGEAGDRGGEARVARRGLEAGELRRRRRSASRSAGWCPTWAACSGS